MNQEKLDQEWQQMESRIHRLVGRFLQNDVPAIEHKPRHLALLQLPQENKNEEMENFL